MLSSFPGPAYFMTPDFLAVEVCLDLVACLLERLEATNDIPLRAGVNSFCDCEDGMKSGLGSLAAGASVG